MERTTIDKQSIRIQLGVAILIILFIISSAFAYGLWKQNITDRLNDLEDCNRRATSQITDLHQEVMGFKVDLAKINTQLTNIEKLLDEIREEQKSHKK